MHQIWSGDCTQLLIHPLQTWSRLLTPFACITQNRFQIRRPISRNVLNAAYPNFACWFLPSLAITDHGGKWKYFYYAFSSIPAAHNKYAGLGRSTASAVSTRIFFNARVQRSWRRRLWDSPRTPSPSSWRHLRLDIIRATITEFGSEVQLNERCLDTIFDVTGYFRSPASGHLINMFFNFLGPISPERLDINAPNLNSWLHSTSYTSPPNLIDIAHSVRLYNAKPFSNTQAYISECI